MGNSNSDTVPDGTLSLVGIHQETPSEQDYVTCWLHAIHWDSEHQPHLCYPSLVEWEATPHQNKCIFAKVSKGLWPHFKEIYYRFRGSGRHLCLLIVKYSHCDSLGWCISHSFYAHNLCVTSAQEHLEVAGCPIVKGGHSLQTPGTGRPCCKRRTKPVSFLSWSISSVLSSSSFSACQCFLHLLIGYCAGSCESLIVDRSSWSGHWQGKLKFQLPFDLTSFNLDLTTDLPLNSLTFWEGTLSGSGQTFTLQSPSYFSGSAGQFAEFGFQLSFSGDQEPVFTSVKLNGEDLYSGGISQTTSAPVTTTPGTSVPSTSEPTTPAPTTPVPTTPESSTLTTPSTSGQCLVTGIF